MMYPRVKLLQRLLADDGAVFISIDDNEQALLRLICDEIFGYNNFINNVIWQKNIALKMMQGIFRTCMILLLFMLRTKLIGIETYCQEMMSKIADIKILIMIQGGIGNQVIYQ